MGLERDTPDIHHEVHREFLLSVVRLSLDIVSYDFGKVMFFVTFMYFDRFACFSKRSKYKKFINSLLDNVGGPSIVVRISFIIPVSVLRVLKNRQTVMSYH